MTKHFIKELDRLKKQILTLGGLVEERVRMAFRTIRTQDGDLARHIIESDHEIDEMEVEVEEECLKILALYQPVAVDLRFLVAVIKINNDLERIADEAVNIAQRVENIAKRKNIPFAFDYSDVAAKAETMLANSLDALVNLDATLAHKVILLDEEIDAVKRAVYDLVKQSIRENPDCAGHYINYLLISRHIERIADHATNIAEEAIYLIEGEIVRHSIR